MTRAAEGAGLPLRSLSGELKRSVESWLRDESSGRRLSQAKNFARRLLAR
jgi:hypothetical protein